MYWSWLLYDFPERHQLPRRYLPHVGRQRARSQYVHAQHSCSMFPTVYLVHVPQSWPRLGYESSRIHCCHDDPHSVLVSPNLSYCHG